MTATAPVVALQGGPPFGGVAVIGVAIAALFVVLGLAYYLYNRRRSKQTVNKRANPENIHGDTPDTREGVPLKTKVWGAPSEVKWLSFLGFTLVVYVGLEIYSYLQAGSPTQMLYTWQAQVGLTTLIGGVGVHYAVLRIKSKYGRLEAVVESPPDSEDGTVTEEHLKVWFHVDDFVHTDDGLAVNAYSESTFLFLFRLPKRHADIPLLRNNEDVRAPPEDKATYNIPERAIEIEPNVYTFRTKGRAASTSADSEIDVQWKDAFSMSYTEKKRQEQDREKLLTDIKEIKATNARYTQRILHLEEALESAIEKDWQQFIDIVEELKPLIGDNAAGGDEVSVPRAVLQQMGGSHSSRDAAGAPGDRTAADVATDGTGGGRR